MPLYGQVVLGPPGSGKTTYCNGMHQYLTLLGRSVGVINLDPANESIGEHRRRSQEQASDSSSLSSNRDHRNPHDEEECDDPRDDNGSSTILPYEAILDVCQDVVNLTLVMEQLNLGPNGGLVYCMEYLEAHVDELIQMIRERIHHPSLSGTPLGNNNSKNDSTNDKDDNDEITYILIDLPGQVELYTHGTCVQNILKRLTKALDLRLCAVQLVDATYCLDMTKFLSAALLSTTSMLRLELPTISVLSKMDILVQQQQQQGHEEGMPFGIDFFLECQDLDLLVDHLDGGVGGGHGELYYEDNYYADDPEYQKARNTTRTSAFFRKNRKLHEQLAEVVNDFGLLSFLPLDISSAESVGRVVAAVDKCNGYVFLGGTVHEDMFQCAMQADRDTLSTYESVADIRERIGSTTEQLSNARSTRNSRNGPRNGSM